MATESLMRVMETTGHDKWLKSEESSSSQHNRASEDLEILLKEHKFLRSGTEAVPNRSGSAPPTMEGSLAAIENVVAKRNSNEDTSLANLNKARVQLESEELSRADPAYLAYYRSNVNLNPRLPPPLISHENQRLVRQVGGSLQLSRAALSTHEEEPEDDKTTAYIDLAEGPDMISLEDLGASLLGRHKSLVDLIQEDFPRTPSPVYNQSRSSSHVASEEGVDPESLSNSLPDPSVETSDTKELNVTSITNAASKPTLPEIDVGYVQNRDTQSVLSISSLERTSSSLSDRKGKSISPDTHLEDGSLISGTSMADSDVTSIESEMKVLNIDNSPSNLGNRYQQNLQHAQQTNLHPQRGGDTYQVLGIQSHVLTQLVDQPYHGYPFGISPSPIYATQTPFMGSASTFYPNLQTSAVFAPPYNLAGYGLNSAFHPPVIAGYPPQVAIPVAFDNTGTPNFDARPSGVPTGGGFVPGVDLQHAYGFYGQPGLVVPPFTDPYMHYIQHCPDEAYNALNQSNPLVSGGGVIGSHPHNGALVAAYSADQQPLLQTSGAFSLPNERNTMFTYPSYYGSPPNVDVSMHFPTPPLLSPIMPGSPMSRISPSGSRNEMRFSPSSSQNSGWPRQRGPTKFDNPRAYSYLEDLKSNTGRKFELSDIAECIVPFSADQHGSRFIQQKLETCGVEEKASVFKEILPHAFKLMSDVFGNYVIQKFFEHGSTEQRKELADQLAGHILPLSMQMYGCRVIQKALEVIGIDQKIELVNELDGHVLRCVRDQNGNHVIQKCIECVPSDRIEFIISAFHGQVGSLSTHPYGCRVIQRVLEFCTDEQQSQSIVDEILESACVLAQDQYGNYVTQHVLERGKPQERSKLIHKLAGKVIQMSHHKFASNVVEKCLQYGDTAERDLLVEEVVGQTEGNDNLLIMMKDQFANYVVQKILEICNDNQREILLSRIRIHLDALRKYTYGKHIVLRFEQLVGEEEIPASET